MSHTFKVWVEIEELDDDGEPVEEDHNLGGALRTCATLKEAEELQAKIEEMFSDTEEASPDSEKES